MRANNDEESQAPKRRKGMLGGTQAKGKEIVSKESRHKKHKSSTPQSTMSSSSVKENNIPKEDNESEQGFNMEILPENDQDEHASTQSAPHEDEEQQIESPTIQLEVHLGDDVVDLSMKRADGEVVSALRGLGDDHQLEDGMKFSTIPEWLMNSMEKMKAIEAQPVEDIDDFLAWIGKAKEKKKAKSLSKITRDDSGAHIV